MDEQKSLRQISPILANRFERIEATLCRIFKRIEALEKRVPRQAPIKTIEGKLTKKQIIRVLEDMRDEK